MTDRTEKTRGSWSRFKSYSKFKIRLLGFEFPRLTAQAKLEGQVRHFYLSSIFVHVAFLKINFKNSVFEKLGGKL